MIVCSCARISCHDIRRTVDWMRASDPTVMITPGKVYRALGKRAECGSCARLFVQITHEGRRGPSAPPAVAAE